MAPSDVAGDAPPAPPPGNATAMGSQSENDEVFDDASFQQTSDSGPSKLDPEPNHASAHKFLKGKEIVGKTLSERSGKLTLLELPVDILRLIVQEVTHTNDLASLALANSTLHSLATPQIYSRFDIVWPDSQSPASDSKNVDALTYGLSTLCLRSKFASRIGKLRNLHSIPASAPGARQFKVDHDYAKYTRKFSVGNGPDDWVSEYHIFKESGKMLGILVSLAIERMANLEAFVWDMPTGVLSDVFLALASLQDGAPDGECKLDRIWIRLHDSSFIQEPSQNSNRTAAIPPGVPEGTTLTAIGLLPPSPHTHPEQPAPLSYGEFCLEYPTFSVLPPLRNLTVLEIDDMSYLDEMSMLIGRSQSRLQVLRVGIASKAARVDFFQAWDGPGLQQVDKMAHWPGASRIGSRRLGGVLGVLLGRVFDLRRRAAGTTPAQTDTFVVTVPIPPGSATEISDASQASHLQTSNGETAGLQPSGVPNVDSPELDVQTEALAGDKNSDAHRRLDGKLRLHTLELERVPLSMQVLLKGIDWSVLTTLTLLDCPHQMTLWKFLARHFVPTASVPGLKGAIAIRNAPPSSLQYHLALKNIHTDVVGPPLIKFIADTLAPNTLEVLFLHDRHRTLPPRVTLQKIFQLAVTRHCKSLRKLLFDSEDGASNFHLAPESTRWLHWAPTADIIQYLTSGKFPQLRELSMALNASEWHTFLRRLPNIPQLRALDISHMKDFPYISSRDDKLASAKELAQQLVDILTLRPDAQLCYVGLGEHCFEILEAEPASRARGAGAGASASEVNVVAGSNSQSETGDDDETTSNGSGFSDGNESIAGSVPLALDAPDNQSEADSVWASDGESLGMDFEQPSHEFRARQILFYDEVEIFKARRVKL
ncbi:uncharacterized protein DNG_03682 [Cephalotrichum gorgonifer]|uniref:F-box domain-containing protein n=1 Tax=Cephalotrichum gorgonifer TaxID=2041049 RepID=A0AAE8MUN1_9PEZI|nr:uncharacterized protein DNG_03682 [Cephalotrichum gorgonifer]